jgi:hypothetical protein
MGNNQRPDDSFVNPEPDVEGHLVGLPGTPGVTEDDGDTEGHMLGTDKRIDR